MPDSLRPPAPVPNALAFVMLIGRQELMSVLVPSAPAFCCK
jgi:hypothetical protein